MTASGGRRIVSREVSVKQPIRYAAPQGAEAEFEPGSRGRVLRNLLGIRLKRDMDRAEHRALLAAQTAYLRTIGPKTRFTSALIRQMHSDWLGGIYEWAGRYRTVELQKGDFRWPPAYRVPENMAALETSLLKWHTPCRPGPLPLVARRIAEVHAELLLIHPFRDGNGRVARWLADLMAFQAGFPAPEYPFEGRGSTSRKQRYIEAVGQGALRNYDLLTAFFAEVLAERLVGR